MQERYIDERLHLPAECTRGKIGVVTVLYNSASVLPDFFTSVEAQRDVDFTVYCVNNASTDDSARLVSERGKPYIVIESNGNEGVAAGNNHGIRAAVADGCEYVLLINNDVTFEDDLFAELRKGLQDHQCAMTTPLMYYFDRPDHIWTAGGIFQPWMGYRCLPLLQGEKKPTHQMTDRRVAYTPTCCVLVHRSIFQDIGLMDERYFVYYDDTDFMLRCWKAGLELFLLPGASLYHKVSSLTGATSNFTIRYLSRNQSLFVHKHCGPVRAWMVTSIYRVYYVLMSWLQKMSTEEAKMRIGCWKEGREIGRQPNLVAN